jgi:uncharacterized membrane protein YcaP (DUF421 family)
MRAGKVVPDALRHCLLGPEKLRSELRSKGHTSLSDIFAVVLEPTGTFAVITNGEPAGTPGYDDSWDSGLRFEYMCCCLLVLWIVSLVFES